MKVDKRIWLVFLFPLFFRPVYSSTISLIDATVQISVCGNGLVEGGEDCESVTTTTQTCAGLGYAGGTLVCDIACSYDTTGCVAATPTPTPMATATPTTASVTASSAITTPAPAAATTSTPVSVPTATSVPAPVLPSVVRVFDTNNSGRIETGEVLSAVKSWVDEWRAVLQEKVASVKCDLNRDDRCDLVDLSILLYYIGR